MATAFAVYCAEDGSLSFYKRDVVPTAGIEFEGKIATAVYEGIESLDFGYKEECYWYEYGNNSNITNVYFADVISPVSISYWFAYFRAVTDLDLSKLDTSNVTQMDGTFNNCKSLTSLDVTNFDTSNVQSMCGLFANCSKLTSLDLTNFDTSSVTAMTTMFTNCSKLETIYVSELWSIDNVNVSISMFSNCSSLHGDIAFDSNVIDATYAKYDGGYLTYKRYIEPEFMLIQNITLYNIADKIRVLNGTEETLTPAEMQTTLETHNTEMTEVLTAQDNLIAQISTVLESKSAGNLPTLSNPATADIIPVGYEAIDSEGNLITGNGYSLGNATIADVPKDITFTSKNGLNLTGTGENLGDATAADVLTGKTFTSKNGMKLVGSLLQGITGTPAKMVCNAGTYYAGSFDVQTAGTNGGITSGPALEVGKNIFIGFRDNIMVIGWKNSGNNYHSFMPCHPTGDNTSWNTDYTVSGYVYNWTDFNI